MVNVLFFKRAGKEFHAAGPVQEKARLYRAEISGKQDNQKRCGRWISMIFSVIGLGLTNTEVSGSQIHDAD